MQGRPAESCRDGMAPIVLLFAPQGTESQFGGEWVSGSEIMAVLGKLRETAATVRVVWRAKVTQEALEPPPWEMFNNRGGSCCCWLRHGSVCN